MTKQLNDQDFALLCFVVLMENGDGILDKSPDYLKEKDQMLYDGYDAMARLDPRNRDKVINWHFKWGVHLPEEVKRNLENYPPF